MIMSCPSFDHLPIELFHLIGEYVMGSEYLYSLRVLSHNSTIFDFYFTTLSVLNRRMYELIHDPLFWKDINIQFFVKSCCLEEETYNGYYHSRFIHMIATCKFRHLQFVADASPSLLSITIFDVLRDLCLKCPDVLGEVKSLAIQVCAFSSKILLHLLSFCPNLTHLILKFIIEDDHSIVTKSVSSSPNLLSKCCCEQRSLSLPSLQKFELIRSDPLSFGNEVCQKLIQRICENSPSLTYLRVDNIAMDDDEMVNSIANTCSELKHMQLKDTFPSRLWYLSPTTKPINVSTLMNLISKCSKLHTVDVDNLGADMISRLAECVKLLSHSLRNLYVSTSPDIPEQIITPISLDQDTVLETFEVRLVRNWFDEDPAIGRMIEPLIQFSGLKNMVVTGDCVSGSLTRMDKLERLEICNLNNKTIDLKHLMLHLPNLKSFKVSSTIRSNLLANVDCIFELAKNLESLEIPISESLKLETIISHCPPRLKTLIIYCRSNVELGSIDFNRPDSPKLPIENLVINGFLIHGAPQLLKACPELKHLGLTFDRLSELNVGDILQIRPELESLHLSTRTLSIHKPLNNLRELELRIYKSTNRLSNQTVQTYMIDFFKVLISCPKLTLFESNIISPELTSKLVLQHLSEIEHHSNLCQPICPLDAFSFLSHKFARLALETVPFMNQKEKEQWEHNLSHTCQRLDQINTVSFKIIRSDSGLDYHLSKLYILFKDSYEDYMRDRAGLVNLFGI